MIRFVELGKQIDPEVEYFAFYNTHSGVFLKFINCAWASLPELMQEMRETGQGKEKRQRLASIVHPRFHTERFKDTIINE